MGKILFYEDKYYLFSNFSAHAVSYKGVTYPTSEHAYQAQKFNVPRIRKEIRIAKSPLEAKKLASITYKGYQKPNWDEIKIEVMYEILREKVSQHEEVKYVLMSTGVEEIIENSPTDYFWGRGKEGTGQNQLGKVWMKIRGDLKVFK